MREKSLPSPRPDVTLYREFQYLVLCFISVLLVFPNGSYYIITTLDLSTAFFNFFVIEFLSHFRFLFKKE